MPHERAALLLRDVRDACDFIGELVRQFGPTPTAEWLPRSALCWQLLVIGEACARLRREAPAVAARLVELPRVVALRNLLAHGYDTIEEESLDFVATHHVPVLLANVTRLAAALETSGS